MGLDDMSCYLFDKITQTGDTSLLNCHNHVQVWQDINDEFINAFGISKEYKLYLQNMSIYVKYLHRSFVNNDKSLLNFATQAKNEAEAILATQKTENTNKYAIVSKYMGFRVAPKTTTVKEFYEYIKLMQNAKEV